MKGIMALGAIIVVTAAVSLPVQANSKRTFISIGTGGPTGVYFATGNAICRLVHKEAAEGRKSGRKHGIRCSAPSTGGSNYNIGQIKQGELDFGVSQSDWQFHAYNGSSSWKGKRFKKLRAVFSVHPEPLHIIVGGKSGITGWASLKGKRVNIGNPGSGQRGTMDFLMKKYGWKKSIFSVASELTSSEQSKALCDSKIDAFIYTVGVPNAGVAAATDGCGAKIVSFDNDLAKGLVKARPFYAWATIPKGTYKTTNKDVKTFGVMATFVSSAAVPQKTVYEVTRAVMENIEDFRKLHPAFRNLNAKDMISNGLSAPIHAGAMKYYKEKGWK
ncbi:MAG: C4-dicarboxylate ABC transporter substrate-binding protein [Rhodospirillaceae bacterium]|nr:C4-dicarboxylate ABC transporter substrate-binding protein [Rhodospirillaceae bacterium]|tara:strand:- start:3328 stop:4317 length:990 start_codon:yes stop_codon:yes gene_type:complete